MKRRVSWIYGVAAASVVLGLTFYFGGLIGGVPYPPERLAMLIVHATPGEVATKTIEALGHWGLRALGIAIHLGAMVLGALYGSYAGRASTAGGRARRSIAGAGAVVVGSWGLGLTAPDGVPFQGIVVYCVAALLGARIVAGGPLSNAVEPSIADDQTPFDAMVTTRRRFIFRLLLIIAGLASAGSILGRVFGRRNMQSVSIVPAHVPFEPPPNDAAFPDVAGISPEFTSNEDFYNVDINLIKPQVDYRSWRLSIHGMVDRPYALSYAELQRDFEVIEMPHTLCCISNDVGGDLISTTIWRGVRLVDVLHRGGLRPEIVDIAFRAAEGYSDSIPISKALEETTLVVFGMNGEALPRAHGFPARIIVPGIYGMKNVKWLTEIEAMDHEYRGYWETRGWSYTAHVKTQSRIDTPLGGTVNANEYAGGISWAGDRGISRVEVSDDGGDSWRDTQLKREISPRTWRLWALPLQGSGKQNLVVRATDGKGAVQDERLTAPHPDGASGLHSVEIEVD